MKKLLLALLVGMSASIIAQNSFSITSKDDTVWMNADNVVVGLAHINIKNNSASTKEVMVRRSTNWNQVTDFNYFCWDQCYPETVDTSQFSLTFTAGQERTDFSGDVVSDGDGFVGCGDITYTFYDKDNTSDSVSHKVYFCTAVGLDVEKNEVKLNNIYPNPATDFINIEIGGNGFQNAQVRVVNMLGATMVNEQIQGGQPIMKLDVRNYQPGIYFIALVVDGKTMQSQRVVIR